MREEKVIEMLQFIRGRTLKAIEATPEEIADTIPEGYNNNIRWQFGHVLLTLDRLVAQFSKQPLAYPEEYAALFMNGTKPADWTGDAPSLSTIRELLGEQLEKVIEVIKGNLEQNVERPFKLGAFEITNLEEIIHFAIYHEGIHLGEINGMKRAMQVTNLWEPVAP